MANRVILIGWDRPIVGREQRAMQLFQKCIEYYSKLQTGGRIESFEPVILSRHGGDLNGFVMLKTDSIWGSVLFHAGYDLLVIIPVLVSQ